jgi:hypothetical protein
MTSFDQFRYDGHPPLGECCDMILHHRGQASLAVKSKLLKIRDVAAAGSEALLRGANPAGKNVLAGHIQFDTKHSKTLSPKSTARSLVTKRPNQNCSVTNPVSL